MSMPNASGTGASTTHGVTHATHAMQDGQAHDAGGHVDVHGGDEHALHLPHGSWWPFWLANAIALLTIGMILMGRALDLNGGGTIVPAALAFGFTALAVVALIATLGGWIKEDIKWWDAHTGTGEHIPKAGILLFIGSEIFLFGGLFATYFSFKAISPEWPDTHHELPLLKTFIFSLFLFASSWTVHKAEHHLKHGAHKAFRLWWNLTILLGAIFLGGQVWEYTNLINEGATLGSSHFMSAFFMLTGTHGLHVFGGLCALVIVAVRAGKGQFNQERHAFPQAVSMYWHFVDIVWVLVYSIIYLGNFLHF